MRGLVLSITVLNAKDDIKVIYVNNYFVKFDLVGDSGCP